MLFVGNLFFSRPHSQGEPTVCVKDHGLHSQKYCFQDFVFMLSWLTQLFSHINLKKNKARALKYSLSCVQTGMHIVAYISAHIRIRMNDYLGHNPWHTVYVFENCLMDELKSLWSFCD